MDLDSEAIWVAIENAARKNGMTCSRLARVSGLDATAFNKCKRVTAAGKPHWPSVETVVKVMKTLQISWVDFAQFFPTEISTPDKK